MVTKPIQLTQAGFDQLKAEFDQLVNTKRPQAIARVARARDFGDLTENSEYHAAREDLAMVEGRIEELEAVLKKATVISTKTGRKTIDLGCTVTVVNDSQTHVFEIVGEWEADPLKKKISPQSPLGQALIGKKVGDKVEFQAPAGTIVYTIKKIH